MSCIPASSGFNGGTVTTPVTVDGGGGQATLSADATDGEVYGDAGAGTGSFDLLAQTDGGLLDLRGADAGTTWEVQLKSATASDRLAISDTDAGTQPLTIDPNGYLLLATHAAPANGDLANGECALWFDQTAASTKLMAKGKDSAGTVKTATLATLV